MIAVAIQQQQAHRDFSFHHGGIVNSHDTLGQRHDRRKDPLEKILEYMKTEGLRTKELFRAFDKSASNKLGISDLKARLQVRNTYSTCKNLVCVKIYSVVVFTGHWSRAAKT